MIQLRHSIQKIVTERSISSILIVALILVTLGGFPQKVHAAISILALSDITCSSNNGNDCTITFPAGVLEDDVVVIFGGHGATVTTLSAPGTGYTEINIHTGSAPIFGAWYKVMGASPDPDVLCRGSGNNADGTDCGMYILRGVDTASVLDQTVTTTGPTTSTNPDPPSITTQTAKAWVIPVVGSAVFDGSVTQPTNYLDLVNISKNESADLSIAGSRFENPEADAEDPGTYTSWASGTWYAITIAIRPVAEVAPTVTTDTATAITTTTATLNGNITATGGLNATDRGFAWGTDSALSNGDTATTTESGDFGTGTFSTGLTSLAPDTQYFFRAYATNVPGTGYGSIDNFTTTAAAVGVGQPRTLRFGTLILLFGTLIIF